MITLAALFNLFAPSTPWPDLTGRIWMIPSSTHINHPGGKWNFCGGSLIAPPSNKYFTEDGKTLSAGHIDLSVIEFEEKSPNTTVTKGD